MKIRPTVLSMSFSLDLVPIRVISVIRGSKFGWGCAALGNPLLPPISFAVWCDAKHGSA
jgi:hypothetical protein